MAGDTYLWDRLSGESRKAHAALLDYCTMGPGRSIRKLHARYLKRSSSNPQAKKGEKPPTESLTTLFTWSARYDWPDRAEAWDAHQRAERTRLRSEARRRVEDEGLADADRLLREWQRAFEEGKARATAIAVEAGARVDGQPTVMVVINPESVRRLARARLEIESLRRRALGMPEKVSQGQAVEMVEEVDELLPDLSHLSVEDLLALVEGMGEGEDV